MKFIIPILVGAAIGYFTNYLAIKMLFRPLEEKRIFGIKVPFTPGLIPKERNRIAKSLGDAVGNHLLTSKKITEIVSNDETKEKLENFIRGKIDVLKESDRDIRGFLTSIDYQLPVKKISDKIFYLVRQRLGDKKTNKIVSDFFKTDIYPLYKDKVIDKILNDGKTIIKKAKSSKTLEIALKEDIDNKLNELKDTDIILSDVIDEDLVLKLQDSVDINKKEIMDGLRELFYKETIQEAIVSSIEDLVELNLSKMITMFIESKTISEKIVMVIKKYIDSEESEEAASFIIKDTIKNLMNTKVSTITEKSLSIVNEEDLLLIYKDIFDYILKDESIDKFIGMIIKNINDKESEIKEKLDYYLVKMLEEISKSNEFEMIFKKEIEKSINQILDKSFSFIFRNLDEENLDKIFKIINNIVSGGFEEDLFEIVSLFDISKEVEDEINSFEVEYTENLILEIADRELKVITRLGALLGAIMGLLTPFLQML